MEWVTAKRTALERVESGAGSRRLQGGLDNKGAYQQPRIRSRVVCLSVATVNNLKHQPMSDAMHNESMQHSIGQESIHRCGRRLWRCLLLGWLLALATVASALAQTPGEVSGKTEPDVSLPVSTPSISKPKLRGAVTTVLEWGPDYMGSKNYGWSVKPGLLLRYGRWSVSSNGSFAANTDDPNDLPRGLGLNLLGDEHDWVKLSLRVDSGRRSKDVAGLQGVDDVPRTLRLRLSARKELDTAWVSGLLITPGVNLDLLGKGVGQTVDVSLGKDWKLSPRLKWSVSTGVTWASGSYMRSYFGITPGEASRSGYSVYDPGAGLRDGRVGVGLRYEISRQWVVVANASAQRLLGQAADSPLTRSANQWGAGAGLGWRF